MATPRKGTKADTAPDLSLSEQQRTAVDLIVSGRNLQDTADAIGVQRQAVSKWVHHHAGFQAALNLRRQELWADLKDHLRSLGPQALQVLEAELRGDNRLAAAREILRALGLANGIGAPSGPTDPELIAQQQRLDADARQHAADEAETTIRRRTFERGLAALAAGPIVQPN